MKPTFQSKFAVTLFITCSIGATFSSAEVIPYEVEVFREGNAEAEATSTANLAESIVAAFGPGDGGFSRSTAYASSESSLEVRGGTMGQTIEVDITYTLEVGTWKSPDDTIGPNFARATADANSLVDIADFLDPENSVWEFELDLQTFGSTESEELDAASVTATVSLQSGHDYIVALETFAEAWADGQGWARAEAIADPVFSINQSQTGWENFSVENILPPGSSFQSVPEPSAFALFLGLCGLGLVARRRYCKSH